MTTRSVAPTLLVTVQYLALFLLRIHLDLVTWRKPVSEGRIGFLFETEVPKQQAALVWQQLVKPS